MTLIIATALLKKLWLKLISWIKTSKWAIYAFIGVVGSIIALLLRSLFSSPTDAKEDLPVVPPQLQQAVDKAQESALVAKATAAAVTDAHITQMQQISTIPDGSERRKQLAALLGTM